MKNKDKCQICEKKAECVCDLCNEPFCWKCLKTKHVHEMNQSPITRNSRYGMGLG